MLGRTPTLAGANQLCKAGGEPGLHLSQPPIPLKPLPQLLQVVRGHRFSPPGENDCKLHIPEPKGTGLPTQAIQISGDLVEKSVPPLMSKPLVDGDELLQRKEHDLKLLAARYPQGELGKKAVPVPNARESIRLDPAALEADKKNQVRHGHHHAVE